MNRDQALEKIKKCLRLSKSSIEQYIAAKHPNLTSSKPRDRAVGRNVRSDDFGAGARAGQSARLDRGIGAADGPKLLGGA